MFEAIENDDLAALKQQLEGAADVDARDAEIDEKQAKQLRRAVHQWGDLAIAGKKLGRTPLMVACRLGRLDAARTLIEAGADLTLRDALGSSPLLLAIEGNRQPVVDLLLERGADPNDKDGFGGPALTRAFDTGSLDLARRLLGAGASATPRCKIQMRPLRALIEQFPTVEAGGAVQIISFDDEEADEDDQDPAEPFDLDRALAMVRELLAAGAKINDRELLGSVVMTDEPELLRALVDAGADWQKPIDDDDSLIGHAIYSNAVKIFEILLEWGAEPSQPDGSILMMPIANGNLHLLERLIEVGADVETPINDEENETPLMRCASSFFGNVEALKLLIEAGAELDRTDKQGRTALMIAEEEGNAEAAAILIDAGASRTAGGTVEQPDDEDQDEDDDEDAQELPVSQRVGAVGNDSGNTWEAILIRRPVAELITELDAADEVASVREVAPEDNVGEPLSDLLWLVELADQEWTLVTERYRSNASRAAWLSTASGARTLYIGYNDTACATYYQLFEEGETVELFESTGEDFDDDAWDEDEEEDEDEEMLDSRFESKLRNPAQVDFRAYDDEDAFVEDFLFSQRAYVPLLYIGEEEGRLALEAYPEDVLAEGAVRRTAVVTLEPHGIQKRWRQLESAEVELFDALRAREPDRVRRALAAEPDLTVVPPRRKQSALGEAGASPELVRILLEAGADPDDGGEEPCLVDVASKLSMATRDGLDVMHQLLEAGADPNLADDSGQSPLSAAISNLSGVRLLLKYGADPTRDPTLLERAQRLLAFRSSAELKQTIELLEGWEPGESTIDVSTEELIDGAENPYEEIQESFAQLGELMKLTEAAQERDGNMTALGPAEVHLEDDPQPPDDAMEEGAAAFEALGFERAGAYLMPEMPGVRMIALAHAEERLYGLIYRHPAASRPICDISLTYEDGHELTTSNSPQGGQLDTRPDTRKLFRPELGVEELYRLAMEERRDLPCVDVSTEGFVSDFEQSYRKDMEWRLGRGVSLEEILRIAGSDTDAGDS